MELQICRSSLIIDNLQSIVLAPYGNTWETKSHVWPKNRYPYALKKWRSTARPIYIGRSSWP